MSQLGALGVAGRAAGVEDAGIGIGIDVYVRQGAGMGDDIGPGQLAGSGVGFDHVTGVDVTGGRFGGRGREAGLFQFRFCVTQTLTADVGYFGLARAGAYDEVHVGVRTGEDPEGAFPVRLA